MKVRVRKPYTIRVRGNTVSGGTVLEMDEAEYKEVEAWVELVQDEAQSKKYKPKPRPKRKE